MYILGISCYFHDAAACLVKDGIVVAAAEEERFTRKKHDNSFPINAINYCLKEANIATSQLDYVAFYEKPMVKFERLLHTVIDSYPLSYLQFVKAMPSWFNEKLRLPSTLKKKLKYKGSVLYGTHHLSHAASAFLLSPYKEAALLTIDGVGEWATASYGIGIDNKVDLYKEIRFPNSLGLLFSAMTYYLGFKVNDAEYKVMGLASYGHPRYMEKLKRLMRVLDDGSFETNMSYFTYHYKMKMLSKRFYNEFGKRREPESEIHDIHRDLASSLQKLVEDVVLKMANHVYNVTNKKYLCMAGGVALNCVANTRVLNETPFENIFIQPAASDAGGAMGVALYVYNTILGNQRVYTINNVYLGPKYDTDEIKRFLEENNINYTTLEKDELIVKVAKLIANNKVVGWFQGRMEWGPRALGNRSILANACNPDMKDILNLKVKHREEFRPFAPVAPLEEADQYFRFKQPIPFMLFVCDVQQGKSVLIPSVTHIDGTARLQTVTREQNPLYYDLIKAFGKITGVPVIINTSFNVRGEPIVCNYEDAYNCFKNTGIDYLVMDKFLITKE